MITHTSNPDTKLNLVGKEGTGSTIYDYSGNGNHGTLVNSPSWVALNNCNYGLDFNGTSQYSVINDNDSLSFGNGVSDEPFTISYWAKPDNITTYMEHIAKYSDTAPEYLTLGTNTGAVWFQVYSNLNVSNYYRCLTNAGFLTPNEWHMYSFTYDGSGNRTGMKAYKDGQKVPVSYTTFGTYTAMNNGSGDLVLGAVFTSSYVNLYSGGLSQFLIIRRELTPDEIYKHYQQTFIS